VSRPRAKADTSPEKNLGQYRYTKLLRIFRCRKAAGSELGLTA